MRKKKADHRRATADVKYKDQLVQQFINNLMDDGKKSIASRLMYSSFDVIAERTGTSPLDVFYKAISNVSPTLEVKSRRVGGANYQVPTEVRSERKRSLAIRWLIQYAYERKDKSMALKLAAEFIAASNNEGGAVKKKEDTHRMAEANKAFAHFRW
ncbi:MAG TPA: 30S ribosomal protein S7 [Candidatus Kapabacteria bacterium]|nr:30S ribosomal protein S7 [Candidatus Kapabacteria bacterium]